MHPVVERFLSFLDASPTSFHAAAEAARRLEARGFSRLDERAEPSALRPGDRRYVLRGGTIIAFRVGGAAPVTAGFRIVSAHTDSPNLRIKPQPYLRQQGYLRLGLEVYGGVILATWADRDLGLAGVAVVRSGAGVRVEPVTMRRPLCRIPNLAIHLNRQVNEEGLKLNAQTQLPAVLGLESEDPDPVRSLISGEIGCEPCEILTWDLALFDLSPAAVGGLNGELLSSARLDNLGSSHAGLEGLVASLDDDPAATSVLALFDHEEVGSHTARGADGRMLESVLERIVRDAERAAPGGLSRAIASSLHVSADMAHAVHPGWAEKHDAEHMPRLNGGPVIKQNVSQRYATEPETAAAFLRLCERAETPFQWFVNRSDLACGSTVGPLVASRLGVPTVDVGNPMLSMHSARETCGSLDAPRMADVLRAHFAS